MAENSYEILHSLPEEVTSDMRTAVVIPAFFHTGWNITNGTFIEQVRSYVMLCTLHSSVEKRIPYTIPELISCLSVKMCSHMKLNLSTKKFLFTHVRVFFVSNLRNMCLLDGYSTTDLIEVDPITLTSVGQIIYRSHI